MGLLISDSQVAGLCDAILSAARLSVACAPETVFSFQTGEHDKHKAAKPKPDSGKNRRSLSQNLSGQFAYGFCHQFGNWQTLWAAGFGK